MKRITVLIHLADILLVFPERLSLFEVWEQNADIGLLSPIARNTTDEILFKMSFFVCVIITRDSCRTESSYPSRKVKGVL